MGSSVHPRVFHTKGFANLLRWRFALYTSCWRTTATYHQRNDTNLSWSHRRWWFEMETAPFFFVVLCPPKWKPVGDHNWHTTELMLWYSNWQRKILKSNSSSLPRWRGVEWALMGQAGKVSVRMIELPLPCMLPCSPCSTSENHNVRIFLRCALDFKGLPWCTIWWSIFSRRTTCLDRVWCILISPRFGS